MFNMDIMKDAEKLVQKGWSFGSLNVYLCREGYALKESLDEATGCGMLWELSNGWVVVGLM